MKTKLGREKYGIEPNQYTDFKSFARDKADNIQSVYKVGTKTANELLQEIGTLDNIIQNAELIKNQEVTHDRTIKTGVHQMHGEKTIG